MKKLNEQQQKYLDEKEKELKAFIAEHPKAIGYQAEIDATLNTCDQAERLEILFMLLAGKFKDLSTEVIKLDANYKKRLVDTSRKT
jgi:hypothetical protein